MKNRDERKFQVSITLPHTSTSILKGKQSVRTTFKLPERTISAVSVVAANLGIKQKSLFDQLMDDIEALSTIAHKIQNAEPRKQPRFQKTYVISRKSLESLDQISKHYKASRDTLVEYSVQRLLPIIRIEKEKHEKRKAILAELVRHLNAGKRILAKSKELLGEDDQIVEDIESAIAVCENRYRNVESFIEKGKIIEEF